MSRRLISILVSCALCVSVVAGRTVAFHSFVTNLVLDDTNNVFVRGVPWQ